MGYMMHHAIIVTGWQDDHMRRLHELAIVIFEPTVTPLVTGTVNVRWSFMIGPDGSKEGWAESNEGDERRTEFLAELRTLYARGVYVDWCEIRFGGDDPDDNTRILDHNGLYIAEHLAADDAGLSPGH